MNEATTESLAAELPALDFFSGSEPENETTIEPSATKLPDLDFFSGAVPVNDAGAVSAPDELPPFDFFAGSGPAAETILEGVAEPVSELQSSLNDELVRSDEILPPIVEAEHSFNGVSSSAKTDDEPIPFASNAAEQDLYTRMNQLEAAPPVENWETYTVAMIPQSETDILVRQIAGALNQAMYRLCLAFNWNLENLTIRPTYMQWTVSIPIALSPEDMIAIVRKETTQEINKIDTGQTPQRPRDEFWSPESMSVAGKDFSPSIHWQDFILRRKNREIA